MTLSELHTVLRSTGLPVGYGYFQEKNAPSLPCITYEVAYSNNFGADDKVHQKIRHIDIFLWTKDKDIVTESKVEKALDDAFLFYQYTETYINAEKAYQIIYEVEIDG